MKNMIVIDDFYKDSISVREFALANVSFIESEQLPDEFPGSESHKGYYSQNVLEKMEKSLGFKIHPEPRKYSFGVFAKSSQKNQTARSVHVDGSDWTALIYLNPPEQCQGGTQFFEHKQTGLSAIPNEERLVSMGYKDRMDFIKNFIIPQRYMYENWSLVGRVAMKFNRMVIFKSGDMFHAAESYFGQEPNTERLTQLFFFRGGESL